MLKAKGSCGGTLSLKYTFVDVHGQGYLPTLKVTKGIIQEFASAKPKASS